MRITLIRWDAYHFESILLIPGSNISSKGVLTQTRERRTLIRAHHIDIKSLLRLQFVFKNWLFLFQAGQLQAGEGSTHQWKGGGQKGECQHEQCKCFPLVIIAQFFLLSIIIAQFLKSSPRSCNNYHALVIIAIYVQIQRFKIIARPVNNNNRQARQ